MKSGLELDAEKWMKTTAAYKKKQVFTLLDIKWKCLNIDRWYQLFGLMLKTCFVWRMVCAVCVVHRNKCAWTSCLARAVCLEWPWTFTSSMKWIFFFPSQRQEDHWSHLFAVHFMHLLLTLSRLGRKNDCNSLCEPIIKWSCCRGLRLIASLYQPLC